MHSRAHKAVRALLLVLAAAGLPACAVFDDFFDYDDAPETALVPIEERPVLEPIHANRFFVEWPEQTLVGEPQVTFTRSSDTMPDFARAYGLGYDELIAANPTVNPWLPGEETPVLLPTQYVLPDGPREGVVLNIAAKRLFYYPRDTIVRDAETGDILSQVVLTFPIGIGRVGWETPIGSTRVVSKAKDPSWYVPASVRREHAEMGDPLPSVVPAGPDNPLGTRVLKLDMPGYLIHGTNTPFGVGMRVSHGCVRLYPENIEFLYELIEIGEPVEIVNEPYLLGHRDGQWYFEAHVPLEDDTIAPEERLDALLAAHADEIDDALASHIRTIASSASGFPIRVAAHDESELYTRLRRVHNTIMIDPDAPTLEEVREMIDEAVAEAQAEEEAARESAGSAPN